MTNWQSLKNAPMDEEVLIRFSSGHIEDATLFKDEFGNIDYTLFDGESIEDTPTHWMPHPGQPGKENDKCA